MERAHAHTRTRARAIPRASERAKENVNLLTVDILQLKVELRLIEARVVDALAVPHRSLRVLARFEMPIALCLELRGGARVSAQRALAAIPRARARHG